MSGRLQRRPVVALAVALVLAVGMGACSGDDGDDAGGSSTSEAASPVEDTLALPDAPLEAVCTVVGAWGRELVDTTNVFGQTTLRLSGPEERRSRYLATWGGLGEVTERLRERLGRIDPGGEPSAPRVLDELVAATRAVDAEIADGVAEGKALDESAYEVASVNNGGLNPSTEKMLSLVYKTLNGLGHELDQPELLAGCGR